MREKFKNKQIRFHLDSNDLNCQKKKHFYSCHKLKKSFLIKIAFLFTNVSSFVDSAVHSLPHLTVLSLSGCSKITDDGVELIAENLQKLRALDLSWCPRITDAALEYIACDLNMLEELTLDRFEILKLNIKAQTQDLFLIF